LGLTALDFPFEGIPKDAPRIDAGVGASPSEGEGADVNGDICVGEGET
jgi:hypothetical protein